MQDITWLIVLSFLFFFLIYLTWEQIYLKIIRKSFKYVIHVNGTRGKSTVCRLIDSILREKGYLTFTKTTGTLPIIIHCDGKTSEVKRLGKANIREQIRMMKQAYCEKAEVLILECMAVEPSLQWHSEAHIIRSDINVITNARHDHLTEMGFSLDEIISSLAKTIPYHKVVICGDLINQEKWLQKAQEKNSEIIFIPEIDNKDLLSSLEVNFLIASKTCEYIKIDEDTIKKGVKKYLPDPGAFQIIQINDFKFINCFSVNDPDSTKAIYRDLMTIYKHDDFVFLVNNRGDRPIRTLQNIALINELKPKKLIITGDNIKFVKRKIDKIVTTTIYHHFDDLLKEKIIFAFGNIANNGFKILNECKKRSENNEC